jgi:hypothetical protein
VGERSSVLRTLWIAGAVGERSPIGGIVVSTVPTWLVWSPEPPKCLEEIVSPSMLDAARAWAERQFRAGVLPRDGTEVIACCKNDADPRQSAYRLKISIVNAPAFRASFAGFAFEGNPNPIEGVKRG